ncbi:MAG: hemolysin family protein [Planctomycetota bacterium]
MSGLWMWAAVGSAIAGGVFSAVSMALHDLSKAGLLDLAERRGGAAVDRAERIASDPEGPAAAVALPRVLFNLLTMATATVAIASMGAPGTAATTGSALPVDWQDRGIALACAAVFVWIAGVLVPQAVAKHAGEKVVLACSGPLLAWSTIAKPTTAAWRFTSEVVRRLVGEERLDGPETLDAELMSVVEEGEREGQIDEAERSMIEAIVDLRSTTTEQVMTPRTEVRALEYTDDFEAVRAYARESGHSRVPVFEENLDHIVGILYAKDLLRYLASDESGNGKPFVLRDILRPALFVPETKTVRELLRDLIAEKVHIAMVADEYGGTSGLITIEDIVEEIVGEIRDEYESDAEPEPGIDVDEPAKSATVDGRVYIDDVNDEIERFGLEVPEHEDYDTVAGYVVSKLGRIPEAGERFADGGLMVEVLEAEATRVTRVRLLLAEGEHHESIDSDEPPRAAG